MTIPVLVTDDKTVWRSPREQTVIDLLFELIAADDKDRVASMLDGTNRTMKSLRMRKVIVVSRPPQ